ncbi:MAG: hypothetical protein NTW50_05215 [Candidatus Berkelbacteria bacterium]|nr:hypothetical protein [Candidatus Berkelbacteria bacterium]
MNCKKLTQLIRSIIASQQELEQYLEIEKPISVTGRGMQQEIIKNFQEFYDEYPPIVEDFFANLEKYPMLVEYFKDGENGTAINFESGIGKYCEYPIKSWNYRRFLQSSAEYLERHKLSDIDWAITYLNRLFLNNYSSVPGLEINFTDLPEALRHKFGYVLKKGNLEIDRLESEAFTYMRGGEVKLGRFGKQKPSDGYPKLGEEMVGGRISVGEAGGNIGKGMKGGEIVVDRMSRANLATSATGGTIFVKKFEFNSEVDDTSLCFGAQGGTFVVNEVSPDAYFKIGAHEDTTVLVKCKKSQIESNMGLHSIFDGQIVCYDEAKNSFQMINSSQNILHYSGLKSLLVQTQLDSGVYVLNRTQNSILSSTEKADFSLLQNGIVLLRDMDLLMFPDEIGKGQRGGVIIIDVPDLSYEEATKMVSKDRSGGIILYLRKWTERKWGIKSKKAEFLEVR